MKTASGIVIGLGALALSACGDAAEVSDDLGEDRVLHTPYVVGEDLLLLVEANGVTFSAGGWQLRSSDSSVFSVETRPFICIFGCNQTRGRVQTLSPGTAELEIFPDENSQNPLSSRTLEVVIPDSAVLLAGSDLPSDGVLGAEPLSEIVLLRPSSGAGPVPFMIDMRRGDDTVFGLGSVVASTQDAPSPVSAAAVKSTRGVGRAWLQLTPNIPGSTRVELSADGERFALFNVDVVDEDSVATLRVDDAGGSALRAAAFTAQDRRIFGLSPEWSVDDVPIGRGHILPLRLEPGRRTVTVCAAGRCTDRLLEGLSPMTVIDGHELPPAPIVGCTQAGASGAPALLAAALLTLFTRRRRRR